MYLMSFNVSLIHSTKRVLMREYNEAIIIWRILVLPCLIPVVLKGHSPAIHVMLLSGHLQHVYSSMVVKVKRCIETTKEIKSTLESKESITSITQNMFDRQVKRYVGTFNVIFFCRFNTFRCIDREPFFVIKRSVLESKHDDHFVSSSFIFPSSRFSLDVVDDERLLNTRKVDLLFCYLSSCFRWSVSLPDKLLVNTWRQPLTCFHFFVAFIFMIEVFLEK